MPTSRTFALLKPDVTQDPEGVAERAIMTDILAAGFRIVALKRGRLSTRHWDKFYREHQDRSFFAPLCEFMASGPVVAMVLELRDVPEGIAVSKWRTLLGSTDPRVAWPDTIRGRWGDRTEGAPIYRNAAHGSDSPESVVYESRFFFATNELEDRAWLDAPESL